MLNLAVLKTFVTLRLAPIHGLFLQRAVGVVHHRLDAI